MFMLYVFAVVVGGGLLAFSFLGGDDADAHHDHGHTAVQWLSLRTATYFLFVFGGVGAVLSKSWPAGTAPIVLVLSLAAGLGVGALVSWAFGWLRRTDSGDRAHDEEFVGLTGRVVLPIRAGGIGKVQVQRGGRTIELLARAVRADVAESALWTSVIVVDMDKGTALVTPLEDPAYRSISAISHTE